MPQDHPTSQDWWQYPPWLQEAAERAKGLKVGANLVYRRVTASTNDDVRSLAQQGAPDGLVVVADEQTHGRGGSVAGGWRRRAVPYSYQFCFGIPCRCSVRLS